MITLKLTQDFGSGPETFSVTLLDNLTLGVDGASVFYGTYSQNSNILVMTISNPSSQEPMPQSATIYRGALHEGVWTGLAYGVSAGKDKGFVKGEWKAS